MACGTSAPISHATVTGDTTPSPENANDMMMGLGEGLRTRRAASVADASYFGNPTIDFGSVGAAATQLDQTAIVYGGDLDITAESAPTAGGKDSYGIGDQYLFSMTSADGLSSVRFLQGTSNNPSVVFAVRSVDVLTVAMSSFQVGDSYAFRAWYRVSTGKSGLIVTLNGESYVSTGVASGSALAQPTSAWLGSNLGAAPFPALWRGYTVHHLADAPAATLLATEIYNIGDSISTSYSFADSPAAWFYSVAQRRSRAGIVNQAVSGHSISDQTITWNSSAYKGQSSLKAIVIQAGINDIRDSFSLATYQGYLNTLIANIAAANPGAKILAQCPAPAGGNLAAPQLAVWQQVKTWYLGGIPGAHFTVTSHLDIMDNGSGALLAIYDDGGGLHPNQAGRQVMGLATRAGLVSLGILP